MNRRPPLSAALPVALLLALACDRTPEPKPEPKPEPAVAPAASAPSLPVGHPPIAQPAAGMPGAAKPSGLTWTDPPEWKREHRASKMRLATYAVPKADGDPEDAELAVFYFGPGAAGGIEANVDRWITQFQGATKDNVQRDQRNVGGLNAHIVSIPDGTYGGGMMGGGTPHAHYAMLAAIVEAPTGAHFFKMTGPAKTVEAARPTFMKLLDGVKVGSK
jgi:hypothetical protein